MNPLALIDIHLPWLGDLLALGGPVLLVILLIALLMWAVILERLIYLLWIHPRLTRHAMALWQGRNEHRSWQARAIRQRLISRVSLALETRLGLLRSLVVLCPLLGLLGTVVGMIEVFDVMAVNSGNNPRTTTASVSRATVSILAGMVVALSGLMISHFLSSRAATERAVLSEHLPLADEEPSHA